LKKLGVAGISRSTVANILRAEGFDPGPKRGADTWNGWVERHARTLWACDFLSKKVWTWRGLVEHFVFFFIHIGSRRVHIAGITTNPTEAWVAERGQEMGKVWEMELDQPAYLIRDLDSKFGTAFDKEMRKQGIEVVPVGPRAPNLNAHAERFVQSVKSECLDHFTVLGEQHLRLILSEFVEHYHEERPHQGLGNKPLADPGQPPPAKGKIRCRKRLGGLLKHYHRQAA
jgi:putative transposase